MLNKCKVARTKSKAEKAVGIISNAGYAEDCSDELLHPGIYDAAKENRAYLGLAEPI